MEVAMVKFDRSLIPLIPWIGITAAIASTIARMVTANNWSLYFLTTSFTAFWISFLLHLNESKKHYTLVEGVVRSLSNSEALPKILESVMQTGFFSGSAIDDRFWLEFCKGVEIRDENKQLESLELLIHAKKTRKIQVEKSVYHLMKVLFDRVVERHEFYSATATEADIESAKNTNNEDARHFIFDLPLIYPDNIRRLFIIHNKESLKSLPLELKERLIKQIEAGVKIKILISDKSEKNFGIYGNIAVGTLNEKTGKNEFFLTKERQSYKLEILTNSGQLRIQYL